jgi:hypothetical protein
LPSSRSTTESNCLGSADKALLDKLGKYALSGSCLHIKKLCAEDSRILKTLISASFAKTRATRKLALRRYLPRPGTRTAQFLLRGLCFADTERIMSFPGTSRGRGTLANAIAAAIRASTSGRARTLADSKRTNRFLVPEPSSSLWGFGNRVPQYGNARLTPLAPAASDRVRGPLAWRIADHEEVVIVVHQLIGARKPALETFSASADQLLTFRLEPLDELLQLGF